jgi:molybdopterin/thiamine biosynthesis adenylyltransferase
VSAPARAPRRVVVVGAGGNIGSHLVPLLARLPALEQLVLVDPDRYEPSNLAGQAIAPRDVGRAKAKVQAARARRIRPRLAVEAIVGTVEQVPLGCLRADWIVACLDSRRARQSVNEMARHLGRPWIDTGVAAGERLARVTIYGADEANTCLECGWDERDYAALEQEYPCAGAGRVAPTAAPAALGALAAALAALACERHPADAVAHDEAETVVVAAAGRLVRSRTVRRDGCRLGDHAPWRIRRAGLDAEVSLGDLFARGGASQLAVAGRRFARRWRCARCGGARERLRATPSLAAWRCRSCGGELVADGFDRRAALASNDLSWHERRLRLRSLGLAAGDVVTFDVAGRRLHLEIEGDRR